ncbi:molybdenum cofactor guanylyltransferase [Lederbergia panacisoli]|uniref:molybdenum cofactor guanylyltransferase n=1 Tax=Lederbergia panacisoli TaxID=1255251 RepID=UPI00214D0C2B|nr:molybdenum cofactor guanylyltransferase [Lederbergia panacisoli]MCR2821306.1 molybdenum cofactor guanylyltransferase [Lederbergia panacisoli]
METIILAGGKSSRMGENKALMKIGGKRVIDRIIEEFIPISEDVILIANEKIQQLDHSVIVLKDSEAFKGQGPLAGILTGLTAAKKGPCFVVACDMPFASTEMAKKLLHTLTEKNLDAVIPIAEGQIHPLFAAYDAGILSYVHETLKEGKKSVKSLLDRINVEYIEVIDSLDLWNMNTKEDYIEAKKRIEGNELH